MTTTAELIDRIRREFLASRIEPMNRLTSSVISSDTTLTFDFDLQAIAANARMSIELEDLYVWSVNTTTRQAVVQRGYESTTAASHASGTTVVTNPRWSNAQILRAINNELRGLYGDGIYQILTTENTFTPSHSVYGLPVGTLDAWRVWARDPSQPDGWTRLYGYLIDRNANATNFPSGVTITFMRETPATGFKFRVAYRAELGALSTLADNVETTTGLAAMDLLAIGAGMRLTRGRETSRNLSDTQGPTRRPTEVPAGAEMGANRDLERLYQQELFRERARLARLYPPERTFR